MSTKNLQKEQTSDKKSVAHIRWQELFSDPGAMAIIICGGVLGGYASVPASTVLAEHGPVALDTTTQKQAITVQQEKSDKAMARYMTLSNRYSTSITPEAAEAYDEADQANRRVSSLQGTLENDLHKDSLDKMKWVLPTLALAGSALATRVCLAITRL